MSAHYDKEIYSNDKLALKINFSGIKEGVANTSDLAMSLYAYDKNNGKPIFAETLNIHQIRSLYEHLNGISVIKDEAKTVSGKFVETTEEILVFINGLKDVDHTILKVILDKFKEEEKIKNLLNILSEIELKNLLAAYKQQVYQIEIANLKKLLELEQSGNITNEITNHAELKTYVAGQPEKIFQNWIEKNLWVFGIEYFKKHDARKIALFSEGDLLMESMDGFLDLIELKRPKLDYKIFKYDESHKSYYPSPDLSKVIGQCLFYLEKLDDFKLNLEKEYKVKLLRPRIKIIAGRTNDFNNEQFNALRMLNSNLNHIQIISYDYILSCGEKIISNYK